MRSSWDQAYWSKLNTRTSHAIERSSSDCAAWAIVSREARSILRTYSTSFFLVTRFLPPAKRAQVEVIYAAVRYPDEVVDTFPLETAASRKLLCEWSEGYERGLEIGSLARAVQARIPCFVAAFTQVVREHGIPREYYRAFLDAMRMDVEPRPFLSLDELIDSYVYGSATVVGYFLAYVYGPSAPGNFGRCLTSARNLGIALQLTNFLRDVGEDRRRGRVYLPSDLLRAEGIVDIDLADPQQFAPLKRVVRRVSDIAESYYAQAGMGLDAFAADSQTAIAACTRVYRNLNQRIGRNASGILHRESVPMRTKFQVLPASKYWRIPLAYAGVL